MGLYEYFYGSPITEHESQDFVKINTEKNGEFMMILQIKRNMILLNDLKKYFISPRSKYYSVYYNHAMGTIILDAEREEYLSPGEYYLVVYKIGASIFTGRLNAYRLQTDNEF
jgi:hypothetical protein